MNKPDEKVPNIFEYLDFRAFLKDHFTYQKKQKPKYSYRVFAKMGGIPTSSGLARGSHQVG